MLCIGTSQIESSKDRPIRLRMRGDLIVRRRVVGSSDRYVLKDPVTLDHHQLWPEEFALLELLDGRKSMRSMQKEFEQRFRPARLDLAKLTTLHAMFHQRGLVVSEYSGQAAQLLARRDRQALAARKAWWNSLLSIRLRGIDPDRWLGGLDRLFGWLFHAWALSITCLLLAFTALFALSQWSQITARLPTMESYLTPDNLFGLALAFVLLKVLHELGHGLACKHFGGECHEMGVMFLMFTPCLYCDVSDAWLIDSKWKRAWVALAGMWLEMMVAALCVWLWWFSFPGVVNSFAFHVMCVGGLGTLLFNGNPLWRYDGYFVLADLLDRVNLWERSRVELSMGIEQFYFRPGASQYQNSPYDRDRWLMLYALASIVYQWIVTVLVVVVVYSALRVVRLEVLGAALVILVLASAFVRPPLRRVVALLGDRHRLRRLRAGRVGMTLVIVLCLLAGFIAWPLPCHVQAPVLVRPLEMHPVVIVAGGQLQNCVAEGVVVSQGERLAQLSSPMDELAIAAKQGELARQRIHLEGLEAKRGNEPIIGAQIGSTKQAIQGLESELQRLLAAAANLEIRAPVAGRVIAPASRPSRLHSKTWSDQPIEAVTGTDVSVERAYDEMEFWSGTPLERANRGCFLLPGQHLCQIAATDAALEGMVYLTQSQVEWIQVGQSANCRLPAFPADTFRGEVVEVAASAQRDIPIQLAQSGSIPARPVGPSRFESVEPLYVARIRFDSVARTPIPFSSGLVSIQARPLPLATRLWRLLSETFHRR